MSLPRKGPSPFNGKVFAICSLLFALVLISIIPLGEYLLNDKGVTPVSGSMISAIEHYDQEPSVRIGSEFSKMVENVPNKKFKFIAHSKVLPVNSFNESSYKAAHPENYAYPNKDFREGIEVVDIYTNDPAVSIADYCR
jgi:hypothetical protein